MAIRMRRLTTERAATLIVFTLLFAMASRISADPDMWWHIRLGLQSIETGEFVYADAFSHTKAGSIHKNHSWLAQIVMAAVWRIGGHLGMTVYVASLAVGGMVFAFLAGRGSIYMQGFVLALGGACAAAFWSPRPQMFTFVFAALLLFLLRRVKRGGHLPSWALPLLMWVWANLHGGYIVGYMCVGAFVFGEWINSRLGAAEAVTAPGDLRRLAGIALLSLVIMPANPLGLDVFSAPIETLGITGMREFIQEWHSPNFAQPAVWPLILLAGGLIGSAWIGRRKLDATEVLLTGGTLIMALFSARHLSLFAIAAVPVITSNLDAALKRKGWIIARRCIETAPRLALNVVLVALVVLGTAAHVAYVSSSDAVEQAITLNYPAAAAEFLESSDLEGQLFNSYNWGGYLIYSLPAYPVFIDGRTDLYHDFLGDYVSAAFGSPAWSEVFAEHKIGIALIETGGPLSDRLDADVQWEQVYRDDVASVYAPFEPTSVDEQA